MPDHISIKEIKDKLIESFLNLDAKLFLPFLLAEEVKTQYSNKVEFYSVYKMFLKIAERETTGELYYKFKHVKRFKDSKSYDLYFYDKSCDIPKIFIDIIETKSSLCVNILPF